MALSEAEFKSKYIHAIHAWSLENQTGPLSYQAKDWGDEDEVLKSTQYAWDQYSTNPELFLARIKASDPTKSVSGSLFAGGLLTDIYTPSSDEEKSKANASDLLKQFAEHMTAPIDPADPSVQALVKTAGSAAQGDARARGLQGGYAVQNTEHGVTSALNQAYLARSQLGSQALAQAGQLDLGQANLAMAAYNQQYQAQLAQMQAQQSNNQAVGSAIGAVSGMVGSYLNIPGLNATSGASLGGGIAGIAGGGSKVPNYNYTPPSSVNSGNRGGL